MDQVKAQQMLAMASKEMANILRSQKEVKMQQAAKPQGNVKELKEKVQVIMEQAKLSLYQDPETHLWFALTKKNNKPKITPAYVAGVYQQWSKGPKQEFLTSFRKLHPQQEPNDFVEAKGFEQYYAGKIVQDSKVTNTLEISVEPPTKDILFNCGHL